jgi:hypothetical protein
MASVTYYASLMVNNEEIHGTAELLNDSGYVFRADDARQAVLVSYRDPALLLFGLVSMANAATLHDLLRGDHAGVACSRAQEVK